MTYDPANPPTATIEFDMGDGGAGLITVTRSAADDHAVVVFIDTDFEPDGSDGGPGLRINVNDAPTYEGVALGEADG